jgi:hypothetical protein
MGGPDGQAHVGGVHWMKRIDQSAGKPIDHDFVDVRRPRIPPRHHPGPSGLAPVG